MAGMVRSRHDFAERPEESVVRGCVGGNDAAVAELYRRHHGRLVAYFVRHTHDRPLAEDLAHDAVLRFLGAVDRFDETRPVWPYLKVTAHNVLVDHVRRARRQVPVDAVSGFEGADESGPDFAERVVLGPLLRDAMALLPERQRAAVELRYARGWGVSDAADFLGISNGALTQMLFRARRTLKVALEESGARLHGLLVPAAVLARWRLRAATDRARAWASSQPQIGGLGVDGVVGVLLAAGLTVSMVTSGARADVAVDASRHVAHSMAQVAAQLADVDAAPSPEVPPAPAVAPATQPDPVAAADVAPEATHEAARVTTPDVSDDALASVVVADDDRRFVVTHAVRARTGLDVLVAEGETVAVGCDNAAGTVLCSLSADDG